MAVNRGKKFEEVIRNSFEKVKDTVVVRLPDPTSGYLGIRNISDFIIYHRPYQYFIECKTVHGNTLPFSNISRNQWEGMLEVSNVKGVVAGVMCWWVDKDVTLFIPIQMLQCLRNDYGYKSFPSDLRSIAIPRTNGCRWVVSEIKGKKKRVFFDYDMKLFLEE